MEAGIKPLQPVRLSVVIACYNGADLIGEQLGALAAQRGGCLHEVIVADNGSTDGTRTVAESFADRLPSLRVVDASDRRGSGHARNAGLAAATGNAIATLDHDDVVAAGWLEAVCAALRTQEFIAARRDGARLNPEWALTARPVPQAEGLIEGPFLPHAGGCSLAFRRSVVDRIGGFDESYRAFDDVDFCYRAQLQGVTLHFCRDALLYYRLRHSLTGVYRQASTYAEESVHIQKRYLPHGMPPTSTRHFLKYVYWRIRLALRIPLNRGAFARGIWELGWLHGHLRGCLKYRVLAS